MKPIDRGLVPTIELGTPEVRPNHVLKQSLLGCGVFVVSGRVGVNPPVKVVRQNKLVASCY